MQRPLILAAVLIFLLELVGIGSHESVRPLVSSKLESASQVQIHPSKISQPFSATPYFEWIDQQRGLGRARVNFQTQSFSGGLWNFNWVLPPGVISRQELIGEFSMPIDVNDFLQEIELENLSADFNENIIFQAHSQGQSDSGIAIVISTHFDQTKEGEVAESLKSETSANGWQKMSPRDKKLPQGIKF